MNTDRQMFEKGFKSGYDRGRFDAAAGKSGYQGLEEVINSAWEETRSRELNAKIRRRILLVEDEKEVRNIVASWLLRAGFEHHATESAESAIAFLNSSTRVDLVLSNLLLPQIDGFSLLLHVKREYPHIPFVFLTTIRDAGVTEEAARNGAAGFVWKPCTPGELFSVINRVLPFDPRDQLKVLRGESEFL